MITIARRWWWRQRAAGGADRAAGEVRTELRRTVGARMLLVFIVGDILGAGIYALVGEVAGEVGGAIWAAFGAALVLALFTAFAYAELVTKYPQAAGAALYTDRAFGIPFVTFMVAFAVMASGVTSAATLSRAFAGDYLAEFVQIPIVVAAVAFILVVAAINLRGISESVKVNMALDRDRGGGPGADRDHRRRRAGPGRSRSSGATWSSRAARAWCWRSWAAPRWPSTR